MVDTQHPACVVLVVEDEPIVRLCVVSDLEDTGFRVIDACDAEEGLRVFGEHPEITTLFADINMPGAFDGLALAHKIFKLRSGVQLIITSGRAEPSVRDMPEGAFFLHKLYLYSALNALISGRHRDWPLQDRGKRGTICS